LDVKYIGDDLKIVCYDYDRFTANEEIGHCLIKLSALCREGGADEWWTLRFKHEEAGTIHLKSEWKPLMIPAPATPLINAAGVAINTIEELEQ